MRVVVPVLSRSRADRGRAGIPAGPAAEAREVISRYLASWGLQSIADDVLLVATELLTNALRYGTPPWGTRMWLLPDGRGRRYVRLEVADAGPGIDVDRVCAHWRHPSGSLMTSGRGLFIVDTLATRWGDDRSGPGHTVWAELEVTSDLPAARPSTG